MKTPVFNSPPNPGPTDPATHDALAGLLQGNGGISVSIGKPGEGDSDEDFVVRIKADAPVLRPDEGVPANPVL
jgi:hypothetical protein